MASYVLGTKFSGHDTNIALIDEDGQIVFAMEEERLDRIKHSDEFPLHAIKMLIQEHGIDPGDVAYVATPFCHELFHDRIKIMEKYFTENKSFDQAHFEKLKAYEYDTVENYLMGSLFLQELFPNAKLIDVRHHLAHAASAYYCSQFDDAALLSVDANGEIETIMLGHGRGSKIEQMESIQFPHSLGFLYEYVSEWIGLGRLEGPGKTMGLASYGTPKYVDVFLEKVIRVDEQTGHFTINPEMISETPPPLMNIGYLTRIFGQDPKMKDTREFNAFQADIAASIQHITEMIVVGLSRHLRQITCSDSICLAGGVALNCVANEKIRSQSGFKNVFIQPASNDGGTGLGAALYTYYHHLRPHKEKNTYFHPYTGVKFDSPKIEQALNAHDLPIHYEENIEKWAAEQLANGLLIGWFQGGSELGPRALGNRSILADPTKAEHKDQINARIKYREWWRPFAPVVLYENVAEYFDQTCESPYMLITSDMLNGDLPAAAHIDNSARVQTVTQKQNSRLYALISEFKSKTGVPVLLNTSFNVRGEPLINTPEDAINCLFRGGIDALVMGNYYLLKSECDSSNHQVKIILKKGRPELEAFVNEKRDQISKEMPSLPTVISGTDIMSRLLCINALKEGRTIDGFKQDPGRYVDTLGRETLFGLRVE